MYALVSAALAALVIGGCSEGQRSAGFPAPGAPPIRLSGTQSVNPASDNAPVESRRVLVVINEASPASIEIGGYYTRRRQIPKANVVRLNISASETISFDEYRYGIQEKVREAIKKCPNTIDFILLTKGVPIRLRDGRGYSVDGHLMAMNLTLDPIPEAAEGIPSAEMESAIKRCLNPFYQSRVRFSSRATNLYLVTRLDGYEMKHLKALVDNSISAKPEKGPFFFDKAENRKTSGYGVLQQTLSNAHKILSAKGFYSTLEETPAFVAPEKALMGYCSWGSNDSKFSSETYRKIKFKPGAIAETFVSTSGRTFSRAKEGQSLIADLIEQGVTGVKGYVSEPYTFALAHPDVLFDHYTAGYNLAESFYAASPVIKWKDVVIGDPLCNPYAR